MSIASVITQGYVGNVNLVITLGYIAGDPVVVEVTPTRKGKQISRSASPKSITRSGAVKSIRRSARSKGIGGSK